MASTPNPVMLQTIINTADLVETVAAAIDSSQSFAELCKHFEELGGRLGIPRDDDSVAKINTKILISLVTAKQAIRNILHAWCACASPKEKPTVLNLYNILREMKQIQVAEDLLKIITTSQNPTDVVDATSHWGQGYPSGMRSPGSGAGDGGNASSSTKQTNIGGSVVVHQLNT